MRDRLDALVAVGDDDPHSPLHRIKTGSFVFERGRPAGAALESAPGTLDFRRKRAGSQPGELTLGRSPRSVAVVSHRTLPNASREPAFYGIAPLTQPVLGGSRPGLR